MSGTRHGLRVDPVRFGLSLRALRRRRGWTQTQLAAAAGISQTAISRIERGRGDRLTVRTLAHVLATLGARISVRVLSHGEDLDRLLDAGHAEIVERVTRLLRRRGWEVAPEVTFSVYGERGSIDVLATHPSTGALLVVEVKSAVPDVQATLAGIDRKARLALGIARERGWPARSISRWLVLPGDKTSRRRVERHAATFSAALPGRTVEMRRWSTAPEGAMAGVMFVSPGTHATARHRTRRPRTPRPGHLAP
jgi:transcriptional regulator with XRE-family HTH domain